MHIEQYVGSELERVHGWCDKDKAELLYKTILSEKYVLSVEIGVFGGSSLFPQALAFKKAGVGTAFAIDPWMNDVCLEEMVNPENQKWWGSLDLESVYKDFQSKMRSYDVTKHVQVFRMRSSEAVGSFAEKSIDLLHIDGNHSEKLAYEDAVGYLPKVRPGGHIFYDDATWSEESGVCSTKKGLEHLLTQCDVVCTTGKDCVVLRKRQYIKA
jgi:hypothetical protein